MDTFVFLLLVFAAGLLSIPVTVFFIEIVLGVAVRPAIPSPANLPRGRVATIVPAYNESRGLLATLTDIQRQLLAGDRLIVVADNCTDDTAALASAAGAEVVERHDPEKRGKAYALDFGLRYLDANPPDIVIIVDADCRVANNTLYNLAITCASTRRPAQGLYLMTAPDESRLNYQVAVFAWRVKNWLRPLGLDAMGLPCQMMGTGMAFPWDIIRSADLANDSIVEDLKLGLDLTVAGHPPLFCPSACVSSQFASSAAGVGIQRTRWEQGHIVTILSAVPRLLAGAISQRNWKLLALTLDLAVPPLSLLAMLLIGMFGVSLLATVLGFSPAALIVSTANLLLFTIAGMLAWLKCGRDVLPPVAIWSLVPYALGKVGLYRRIFFNRTVKQWIRTDRK